MQLFRSDEGTGLGTVVTITTVGQTVVFKGPIIAFVAWCINNGIKEAKGRHYDYLAPSNKYYKIKSEAPPREVVRRNASDEYKALPD